MAGKFVQIAVGATREGDSVYALDEKGVVWFWNAEDEVWERLGESRSNEDA
jgi:hypothetical protein